MINKMKTNKKTFRNVAIFSFIAVICGWIGVGVDKLLGKPSNLESLGALIFIATPLFYVQSYFVFLEKMAGKIFL